MINARGGLGIPVRVDHTVEEEVQALFERVRREQDGRLDILVNDVWGGDALIDRRWFWEESLDKGFQMLRQAVNAHIITSRYGAPLMVARHRGLIVEVTDGLGHGYHGPNLFYSLSKASATHLAEAMAWQLSADGQSGITAVAVTPGYLRSEAMLDIYGVTEANWRDGIARNEGWAGSETPYFIGRTIVALATDPNVARHAGRTVATLDLAEEYGFTDVDGSRPHWARHHAEIRDKEEACSCRDQLCPSAPAAGRARTTGGLV